MFAGHLPTKHFELAHWQKMPVFEQKEEWDFPPDGYARMRIKGKPIVVFSPPLDSGDVWFAVRPIVRVPMRTA